MKRVIDVVGACALVVLLGPVLFAAAGLVRATMGPPVLYRQTRTGRLGRRFELLKLRTMRPPESGESALHSDRARLTPVGRFLRRTSMDELPQLFNVLRGDMSLVGPRPLLPEYLSRYSPEQARRHDVRPGLTGLVQVSGRNSLSWNERFALDVWYVDNRSLWLDAKILLKTALAVVSGRGACDAHATSEEFLGDAQGTR